MTEPDTTRTTVLKAEFGRNWRWWAWFRQQWSVTSLSVLGAVVAVVGSWAWNVQTRVIVLETKVVPVLEEKASEAQDHADIADLKGRIGHLEDRMDYATEQAGTAPTARRRK